jgi:hypothetical protein
MKNLVDMIESVTYAEVENIYNRLAQRCGKPEVKHCFDSYKDPVGHWEEHSYGD